MSFCHLMTIVHIDRENCFSFLHLCGCWKCTFSPKSFLPFSAEINDFLESCVNFRPGFFAIFFYSCLLYESNFCLIRFHVSTNDAVHYILVRLRLVICFPSPHHFSYSLCNLEWLKEMLAP